MAQYEVIDNFLPQDIFEVIKNHFMGHILPWYYQSSVATLDSEKDPPFYFTHALFVDYKANSDAFNLIFPLIQKIEPKALIRIKANLYPNSPSIIEHDWHTDFPSEHKAAIFYINTNNGFTILEDGTKIQSVANRLLKFDGSKLHKSTTCTDEKVRVNIGFNYF
jgi:hypothetical protein